MQLTSENVQFILIRMQAFEEIYFLSVMQINNFFMKLLIFTLYRKMYIYRKYSIFFSFFNQFATFLTTSNYLFFILYYNRAKTKIISYNRSSILTQISISTPKPRQNMFLGPKERKSSKKKSRPGPI